MAENALTAARTIAAGLLGMAAVAGGPAWADGFLTAAPRPDDVKAIEACLGADKTSADRRHCIGLVSDACQAAPDGQSTMGMEACQSREYVVWDKILNAAYQEALKRFDEAGKTYLKTVQTTWIGWRDQSCQWPSRVFPNGTIAGPLAGRCLIDETANRTLTLLDIAAWLAPH